MKNIFEHFTIIPSIRRLVDLEIFLKSNLPLVFLSEVHIGNLTSIVKVCKEHNKKVLVNAELIGGFSPDKTGLKLLKDLYGVDGVISSNSMVLNMAKATNLYTVQRFFLIDSRAFDNSLKNLNNSQADAIELLPSLIAPKFYKKIVEVKDCPILAGGFVTDTDSIANFNNLGFSGVTTSSKDVWMTTK